jgi:hypothetical protein
MTPARAVFDPKAFAGLRFANSAVKREKLDRLRTAS